MSINWGATGAQAQSLTAYLVSLGLNSTYAANITTMVNRITTAYPSIATHLLSVGHIDSYVSAGNQGYVPDFSLEVAFSGLTRYIMDVCVGTWNDTTGAPKTASIATVLTWMQTYRPDISSQLATLLEYVVATDINSNLLLSGVVTPSPIVISNDASSSLNIYKRAVGNLLRSVAQYLRHYCSPTTELNSNSSSNGSYIEGLDVVSPVPGQ